jgi:hypothetical protein
VHVRVTGHEAAAPDAHAAGDVQRHEPAHDAALERREPQRLEDERPERRRG